MAANFVGEALVLGGDVIWILLVIFLVVAIIYVLKRL